MPGAFSLEALFPRLSLVNEDARLKVGIMSDATNIETNERVAAYAADNEYGTRDIPSRPFLRSTFDANERRYVDFLAASMRQGADAERALRLLGEAMVGDIKISISHWETPPNSPATLADKVRRGHGTHPLRDTGSLLRSITYRVDVGGKDDGGAQLLNAIRETLR